MGIPLEKMSVWTPGEENTIPEGVKIVLWHGFCSVHKRFTVAQIEAFREEHPNGVVVVHPECPMEVVQAADANGSTEFIRRFVAQQEPGTHIAVGTETTRGSTCPMFGTYNMSMFNNVHDSSSVLDGCTRKAGRW